MKKRIPTELEGEYTIRLVDLPVAAHGFVTYDDDDFANIYINARLSHDMQRETAEHEIDHVINDDIHSEADIRTIEHRADHNARKEGEVSRLPKLIKASELPNKPLRKQKDAPPPPVRYERAPFIDAELYEMLAYWEDRYLSPDYLLQ